MKSKKDNEVRLVVVDNVGNDAEEKIQHAMLTELLTHLKTYKAPEGATGKHYILAVAQYLALICKGSNVPPSTVMDIIYTSLDDIYGGYDDYEDYEVDDDER